MPKRLVARTGVACATEIYNHIPKTRPVELSTDQVKGLLEAVMACSYVVMLGLQDTESEISRVWNVDSEIVEKEARGRL